MSRHLKHTLRRVYLLLSGAPQITVTKALPDEVKYLQQYDKMKAFVNHYIDMPDRTADLLIRFLHQNDGKLSNRDRSKEFSALTDEEVQVFENKFEEISQ